MQNWAGRVVHEVLHAIPSKIKNKIMQNINKKRN
jgi:hypothetical protein